MIEIQIVFDALTIDRSEAHRDAVFNAVYRVQFTIGALVCVCSYDALQKWSYLNVASIEHLSTVPSMAESERAGETGCEFLFRFMINVLRRQLEEFAHANEGSSSALTIRDNAFIFGRTIVIAPFARTDHFNGLHSFHPRSLTLRLCMRCSVLNVTPSYYSKRHS